MSGSLSGIICALLVPQSAFSLLGFSCLSAMEGALGVFYGWPFIEAKEVKKRLCLQAK
jgi:hypothetical protein